MPKRTIREKYSPAAWTLYEYRITTSEIADKRRPKKSRTGVTFELTGRNAFTEETAEAILEISDGNFELLERVKGHAREAFLERNPDIPKRRAFRSRKVSP